MGMYVVKCNVKHRYDVCTRADCAEGELLLPSNWERNTKPCPARCALGSYTD